MDYGKLAYYKVEELEQRLALKSKDNIDSGVRRAFYPKYNFGAGDYAFTTLSAVGVVALVFKIKVLRLKKLEGSILLNVATLSAGAQDISGEAGLQEYVALASVSVSGSADIILRPSAGLQAILQSVELVAIGGGAILSGGLNHWNADFNSVATVAALSREEQIYVVKVGGSMLEINVGRGHILDIVSADNGFSLVYCDDLNNSWGVRLDNNLVEQSRRFLGEAAQAVTVATYNGRLVIAYLKQGVVTSKTCDNDFGGRSVGEQLEVGLKAEDIRFVKQASTPMLMVYSGGAVYLKFAAEQTSKASNFSFTSKFSYAKTV